MLNKIILSGRISNDLELKQAQNGVSYLKFNIAVDRNYAKNGKRETDFISCIAWNKSAEFISNYFSKGRSITVIGNIRNNVYEVNGERRYSTYIFVEEVHFTFEPRKSNSAEHETCKSDSGFDSMLFDESGFPF